jgi:hypothetical protein
VKGASRARPGGDRAPAGLSADVAVILTDASKYTCAAASAAGPGQDGFAITFRTASATSSAGRARRGAGRGRLDDVQRRDARAGPL